MTIDTTSPSTRRALLGAGLGAIVASVASALGRPAATQAANGDPVKLGESNSATLETKVTVVDADALVGESSSGTGVEGTSTSGTGVSGRSDSGLGVVGISATSAAFLGLNGATAIPAVAGQALGGSVGVAGISSGPVDTGTSMARLLRRGVLPAGGATLPAKTGVYGEANQDQSAVGVGGHSVGGTGVRGSSASGFALSAQGRLKFSTSGIATIQKGSTAITIAPGVNVTPRSFLLLTPKANIGTRSLWFTTHPGPNTFTIRISAAAAANLKVAWLLVG